MIKEKLKNCLLTVILSILFIASMFAIIGLSSCNVKKTILSNDINIENDNLNLKKDYHLDPNGDIVSENLLNPSYILLQYTTTDSGIPTTPSANNRAVTNYLPISPNTTYTIHCTNNLFLREVNFASSIGNGLGAHVINLSHYTFTTPSNANFLILLFGVGNQPDSYSISKSDIIPNCMFNIGSTNLTYEPFGVWFPHSAKQNFLNGFYGWEFYLHSDSRVPHDSDYTGLKSFIEINDINFLVNSTYSNQFFNDSYIKYLYNSPITLNSFTYFYVWSFGMEFTFNFYNGDTLVYSIDSNNSDRSSFVYTFDREYQFDSLVFISKDGVWEEDTPMCCLSYADTITSYNDGVRAGQQQSYDTINSLNATINEKDTIISDLQFTIRSLNEQLNNNINGLFYTMISSVMSTPFNILHDYLNWNFFGINLFSLFTSLVTLLIILWIVKFLLGRK